MAAKLTYPTGVRPLLIEETARRRRIESRFIEILERGGFAEITLPIIDYVEPYASLAGGTAAKQSYRFVDREGDLVAIRADFTPMLARALAPAIADETLPLRLFYRGDVIRCEASRLGENRELFRSARRSSATARRTPTRKRCCSRRTSPAASACDR